MLNPYKSLGIKKKVYFSTALWLSWLINCSYLQYPVIAKNISPKPVNPEISNSCSEQSLETLTTQLMLDLPSYANRSIQRARILKRSVDTFSYILAAGKPEFESLPLNPGINNGNNYETEGVKQVFFTTLERTYIHKKPVELQEFHRLFLTKTNIGWTVVMMFTQDGSYPVKPPIAPPRNSSNGAIAQGVKLWLRDCQAGSVR
ncbi:hypothetical protein FJR11_18000 [Anabaena sp. UHCC 0187]|uniref:hypothetical protein n=1 Tax=Anabaena sp. UHCC 0187 TaxID=2590018 RepID=UPI0014455ECD|nr:hypothetical protein [Anabaena sp. UHCC 0187]MDP5018126.1 hypothetical protein [Dolichospermum sp.]MTJ14436.1 hypothetical protein [Anabaena sp. UHCC 0187]